VHSVENAGRVLETYAYDALRIVMSCLKLDPSDLLYAPAAPGHLGLFSSTIQARWWTRKDFVMVVARAALIRM